MPLEASTLAVTFRAPTASTSWCPSRLRHHDSVDVKVFPLSVDPHVRAMHLDLACDDFVSWCSLQIDPFLRLGTHTRRPVHHALIDVAIGAAAWSAENGQVKNFRRAQT